MSNCECKCKKPAETLVATRLRERIRVLALHDEQIYDDLCSIAKLKDDGLMRFILSIKEEVMNKRFNEMYTQMMYDNINRSLYTSVEK